MDKDVFYIIDSKGLVKAISKGVVRALLTVSAIGAAAKFINHELKKKLDEDKKASEVEEVTDENSDEE